MITYHLYFYIKNDRSTRVSTNSSFLIKSSLSLKELAMNVCKKSPNRSTKVKPGSAHYYRNLRLKLRQVISTIPLPAKSGREAAFLIRVKKL